MVITKIYLNIFFAMYLNLKCTKYLCCIKSENKWKTIFKLFNNVISEPPLIFEINITVVKYYFVCPKLYKGLSHIS